jgi:hypothetical protein
MPKTVSISWLKLKSGNYALKGIAIHEAARAYDSTSTFRDEDARWLTKMLGAQPHVELSGNGVGQRTSDDYPGWALDMEGHGADSDSGLPLDWERAGATLLRHSLGRLAAACDIDHASMRFQELIEEAKAALMATEVGTYYNLDEARTVLDRRSKKPARVKSGP